MKTCHITASAKADKKSRLAVSLMMISMLAACGGGDSPGQQKADAPVDVTPAATPIAVPAVSAVMAPLAPLQLALIDSAPTLASTNQLAFAIKADSSLWAWGAGSMGELGDGERITRLPEPTRVGDGYRAIATGVRQNTIGVKNDGSLWAWGRARTYPYGLILDYKPVQLGDGYLTVSAGLDNYAIKADGTLWAWSVQNGNSAGELGDGTAEERLSPVQIGTDFASVSANSALGGAVGVKRDGTLWAWGPNRYGTVGDGSTTDRQIPVKIGKGFVAAVAGCYHAAGLKNDGTVWTWGGGGYGQLGNGSTADVYQKTPIQVATGFVSIAAGCTSMFGIRADGSSWAWGGTASGQLGDGVTAPAGAKGTPTRMQGNFTQFGAGLGHTLALRPDGSLWEWGIVLGMKFMQEKIPTGVPVQIGIGFSKD